MKRNTESARVITIALVLAALVTQLILMPPSVRAQDQFLNKENDRAAAASCEGEEASNGEVAADIVAESSDDDASADAGSPTEESAAPVEPEDAGTTILIELNGRGEPEGGTKTFLAARGARVRLTVHAQQYGALHLFGYDIEWQVEGGQSGTQVFEADMVGRFPIEFRPVDADSGVVVGCLEVRP